jgi:hypothetical protein
MRQAEEDAKHLGTAGVQQRIGKNWNFCIDKKFEREQLQKLTLPCHGKFFQPSISRAPFPCGRAFVRMILRRNNPLVVIRQFLKYNPLVVIRQFLKYRWLCKGRVDFVWIFEEANIFPVTESLERRRVAFSIWGTTPCKKTWKCPCGPFCVWST